MARFIIPPLHPGQEAGWAPHSVWALRTKDKSLLLQDTESRFLSSSSSHPEHYIDWAILSALSYW